ncbi:hypothetical protein GCM10010247_55710 [Streptomyces calvus]|nr:hypothetical protein GCM10010247_55710 [Streptomyces calvus]
MLAAGGSQSADAGVRRTRAGSSSVKTTVCAVNAGTPASRPDGCGTTRTVPSAAGKTPRATASRMSRSFSATRPLPDAPPVEGPGLPAPADGRRPRTGRRTPRVRRERERPGAASVRAEESGWVVAAPASQVAR